MPQMLPHNRLWTVRAVKDNGVEKFAVDSRVYRIGFIVDDQARTELLFTSLTMMTEDGHGILVVRE